MEGELTKDQTLFYLKRVLRDTEDKYNVPSMEEMAKRGMSYADRQALLAEAGSVAQAREGEVLALRAAIKLVEAQR